MVESSAGKILSQARLAKRLTIDEVAHATKLRPDKIVALENDDFARFGSLAYGKGFLQIYARFLGVDITPQLRGMDLSSSGLSISDYQYLNSPHPPPASQRRPTERPSNRRERRTPSVIPLLIVLGLGAAGLYGFYVLNAPRIGLTTPASQVPSTSMSQLSLPPAAQASEPLAPSAAEAPLPAEVPAPTLSDRPATAPNPAPPIPGKNPVVTASDAAFLAGVNQPAAPNASASTDENAGTVNELIVEPLKKTWVKIHKDTPNSPPIFEDYLYPGVRPLKLRGAKFFVEVRDQGSVQIRKNGHPIAYQAPGISIQ